MTPEQNAFLRDFFRSVRFRPLEPDDPRYVSLYDKPGLDAEDPVALLARSIEWTTGQSVQLFSGFRGTGKSTELRRLRRDLQGAGYLVALFDVEDYLNIAVPVDISDFLMVVTGAFEEAVNDLGWVPEGERRQPFWDRLRDFLDRTRFELGDFEVRAEVAGLGLGVKANLKTDPTFRRRLQQHMAGHLGVFVEQVHASIEATVRLVWQANPYAAGVVLLVDSIDHIRGTSMNVQEVQSSVENLFAEQAERLRLPSLHVVYTVPPYLKVRYPGLSALYGARALQLLRAVKVRERGTAEVFKDGHDALEEVVRARGAWDELLPSRDTLDRIIGYSGGHLRDLLRMIQEVIVRADRLPVDERTIERASVQIQSELLPVPDDDARWLHRIAQTNEASLPEMARLPRLSTLLDTHLVLCYSNGEEWYDVHPLIRERIAEQVQGLEREGEPDA